MAIEIKKEIILNSNITLNSCYIRLEINLKSTGDEMDIKTYFYQNKNMFKLNNSSYMSPYFSTCLNVPYNISNGDPIVFAHKKYIEYLTTDDIYTRKIDIIDNNNIEHNSSIMNTTTTFIDSSKCVINTDENGTTILCDDTTVLFDNDTKHIYKKDNGDIILSIINREKLFDITDVSILDID